MLIKSKKSANVYKEYQGISNDPIGLVRSLIGRQLITRKSDNSFNFGVVLPSILGIIVIIWGYVSVLNASQAFSANRSLHARQTDEAIFSIRNPTYSVPTLYNQGTSKPVDKTATSTMIVTSTQVPTATENIQRFSYSWYDPSLGYPNCWDWDEVNKECHSMMSSGQDWHNYYGRAVACPLEYPLGTVIRVIEPDALKGDWTCLDRGAAIVGSRLDFLTHGATPGLGWYDGLQAEVILP